MLGRKLVLIAAAASLAVSAASQSHVKISVGHRHRRHAKDHSDVEIDVVADGNATDATEDTIELCLPGYTEVSVEGVDGIFCAKDQICVDDIKDGSCPSAQQDLPYGAYCDVVKTGVYGCKPKTKDMLEAEGQEPLCTGEGQSPMSVEGVEGVFCVTGQACVADIADGACPGPQEGLPNGAHCGKVKTGVYGCKPNGEGEDDSDDSEEDSSDVCTGEGESPMSVEGVEGIFCVTGQACVADIADGACPGKQDGLPNGSHCGKVKTGVYGCKPNGEGDGDSDDSDDNDVVVEVDLCTGEGESPMSVEGVEGVFCVTGQACVADIKDGACPDAQEGLPYGAYCGTVKTGVYGCKPKSKEQHDNDHAPVEQPDHNPALCTGENESPMSVEGVEGIFCVTGQACVADIADGACPGPQEGLPNGAHCGKVKTGVYGCKPNEEGDDNDDSTDDSDDSHDEPSGDCNGEGESPMSVEGVEGIFCVTGQACVADIADGACPGAQDGLPNGAVCAKVKTGVYGCVPADKAPAPAPAPAGDCSGEGQSPMSVEGVEGIFCVTGQACVADIKDGACPGPQDGLPNGAECGVVASGVYGCKPKGGKHLRHKTSAVKKGHTIKVVKAHATKKQPKKHADKKHADKKPSVAKKEQHKKHKAKKH